MIIMSGKDLYKPFNATKIFPVVDRGFIAMINPEPDVSFSEPQTDLGIDV